MAAETWEHWRFGLIVTGTAEQKGIEKLFRSLSSTGLCSFKVIGRVRQRGAITSPKHKLKMVGSGKTIPDKDVDDIGTPARRYLQTANGRFVIVIDDLEWVRREQIDLVFKRYRDVLDAMLLTDERRSRAAVHFLVMMLEAYFFADSQATNAVLCLNLNDHPGDVESIRHPKNEIKHHCRSYREVEHGTAILENLRPDHILARQDCCAYLRTLFTWCLTKLREHPFADAVDIPEYPGVVATVTGSQ